MTESNLKMLLQMAVYNSFWKVFNAAPKDTWNLATNALKLEQTATGYVIYVDEAIAPYMKYTEEIWNNGKKNPNEGWFKRITEEVISYLAQVLGGNMEEVNG